MHCHFLNSFSAGRGRKAERSAAGSSAIAEEAVGNLAHREGG